MGTKFHVHHSCGHTALVDSPGPLDPGGLVAKDAPKGMQALNLAARPCFECARVAGPIEPLGPATSMCLYRRGDVTRTEVCTLPLGHPGDHLLVTLPMAPANEPLPSAEDLDAAVAADQLRWTVSLLLVDDQKERAAAIWKLLGRGILRIYASTVEMAASDLREHKFDLILLDHDLYHESGDGTHAAQLVAETQDAKQCRIFIHSQNAGGVLAMKAILAGFDVTDAAWDNAASMAPGLPEWIARNSGVSKGAVATAERDELLGEDVAVTQAEG